MPLDGPPAEHPFKSASGKQHFPAFEDAIQYDAANDSDQNSTLNDSNTASNSDSGSFTQGDNPPQSTPIKLELSIETQVSPISGTDCP
jgi:hypothetical protein